MIIRGDHLAVDGVVGPPSCGVRTNTRWATEDRAMNSASVPMQLSAPSLAAARARGRMGGRSRKMDRAPLMMAMAAMTTTTLYVNVNGDGTPKAAGQAVLDAPSGTRRLQAAG